VINGKRFRRRQSALLKVIIPGVPEEKQLKSLNKIGIIYLLADSLAML
jgi:hypothetical protein